VAWLSAFSLLVVPQWDWLASVGLASVGGLAIGIVSLGGAAIGLLAAVGGVAIGYNAVGGTAIGVRFFEDSQILISELLRFR